jgi:transcription antitermination factor NusG
LTHPTWYVAQFSSGQSPATDPATGQKTSWPIEYATAQALDRSSNMRAFCPVAHRRWVNRGVKHERLMPVLAGYVFVEMEPGDPYRWHEVAGHRGFYGFIGGASPQPCRASSVEDLIIRSTEAWVLEPEPDARRTNHVERGSEVRVLIGHLENCLGTVEWTRDRADGPVAQVRINKFFGMDIRTEMPLEWLVKVGRQEKKAKSLLDLPVIRAA